TMRAILQWNVSPPPAAPGYTPFYGNILDADVQLQKRTFIVYGDLVDAVKKAALSTVFAADYPIPLPDPVPVEAKTLYQGYKKARIPDHRTFFSTVGSAITSKMDFSQATSQVNISEVAALKVDIAAIANLISPVPNEEKANVTFEEVTCI